VLGRLASQIATVLQGKDKPTYAPHVENGDMCVVLNAKDISVTGKKMTDKIYYWHTGLVSPGINYSYASYSEPLLTSSGHMLDPQQVYWASEGKKAQGPDGKRPN
jgi:hypothetical protein